MSPEEMDRLIVAAKSTSEKVRLLFRAGVSKADIGRHLGIRYQQVYNALLRDPSIAKPKPDSGSMPNMVPVELQEGNLISLPDEVLNAIGAAVGDSLFCRVEPDGIKIVSREQLATQLRDSIRARMPAEAALLDALLQSSNRRAPD